MDTGSVLDRVFSIPFAVCIGHTRLLIFVLRSKMMIRVFRSLLLLLLFYTTNGSYFFGGGLCCLNKIN